MFEIVVVEGGVTAGWSIDADLVYGLELFY